MSLNGNRPTYVSVAVAAGTTGFSCGVTLLMNWISETSFTTPPEARHEDHAQTPHTIVRRVGDILKPVQQPHIYLTALNVLTIVTCLLPADVVVPQDHQPAFYGTLMGLYF